MESLGENDDEREKCDKQSSNPYSHSICTEYSYDDYGIIRTSDDASVCNIFA